jgi:RNA-directed DNA polymerase
MAKTYRNLWPDVVDWDNLLLAYQRCRRRKRFKPPAVRFHFNWEHNLLQLQQQLTAGTWTPGRYYNFRIHEPKPRLISAAPFRDRIVHHAVVNILEPIYERRFVFDSYACRRDKGTHHAIRRAQHFLRRYPYYLKTDIVRFFPSVDHAVLKQLLRRTIRDDSLLRLLDQVIDSGRDVLTDEAPQHWFRGDTLLDVLRPKGIPIGNLTSQFFANVLLDPIDHFLAGHPETRGCIRYADDLLIFGDSKDALWHVRDALSERLQQLRLRLHPDKTHINHSRRGVKFLGLQVNSDTCRLTQDAARRFNQKRRRLQFEFATGQRVLSSVRESLIAWQAHVARCCDKGLQQYLRRRAVFTRATCGNPHELIDSELFAEQS